MVKILNHKQKQILQKFSQSKFFQENFYWTGGTALAEVYLKHRLSEDLDFFSEDLYPKELLLPELNKLKNTFKNLKIKYLENKNRQQFILYFTSGENLKLEFVYFPFSKIRHKKINTQYKIKIDSLKSIGENKVFALYENGEPKHVFDLYWIVKKKDLSLKKLFFGSQKKFGVEIDKVIFLEKALEAIEKMDKIKPLVLPNSLIAKNQAIDFFKKIK